MKQQQLRVQLDSRPEAIDVLERKILQLEIESTALGREKDKASKNRLKNVQSEIENLKEELQPLKEKWEADRGRADEIKGLKEKLTSLENKAAAAERTGDFEKAADLKYGAIPDLKSHLNRIIEKEDERKSSINDADDNTMVSEIVTPVHITEIISRWTGIPVSKLSQSDKERLLKLDERLKDLVIGQDQAVQEVVDCVLRARAGLSRENQPTGSFLFLGSSGVGKTELAKALFSELYDGDERHLVRIDMSEYTEPHSVARLVGAPPGYVGHDSGQLTEAVRKPYTVVLFDEVEKAHAHPRVLTILLQLLDEGRLTDSKGRTVDFTNTVIVLTSNLGAKSLLNVRSGSSEDEISAAHEAVMESVRNHFPPEFLNRLSAIVMFKSLGYNQLEKICQKAMKGVKRRLAAQGIRLVLEESGVSAILEASFDPNYGARPVERYLEQTVVTKLSKMLISGEIGSGCIVHIEATSNQCDSEANIAFERSFEDEDYFGVPHTKKPRALEYRIERANSFLEDEIMNDAGSKL